MAIPVAFLYPSPYFSAFRFLVDFSLTLFSARLSREGTTPIYSCVIVQRHGGGQPITFAEHGHAAPWNLASE